MIALTPDEASAVMAWIHLCERYRAAYLQRQCGEWMPAHAQAELDAFLIDHPTATEAIRKLKGEPPAEETL